MTEFVNVMVCPPDKQRQTEIYIILYLYERESLCIVQASSRLWNDVIGKDNWISHRRNTYWAVRKRELQYLKQRSRSFYKNKTDWHGKISGILWLYGTYEVPWQFHWARSPCLFHQVKKFPQNANFMRRPKQNHQNNTIIFRSSYSVK